MKNRRMLLQLFMVAMLLLAGGRLIGPYFWHFGAKAPRSAVTLDQLPPPDEHLSAILATKQS